MRRPHGAVTTHAMLRMAFVAAFLCLVHLPGYAGSQTITLEEKLNQAYQAEWVSYPFSAKKGDCKAESIRLVGPNGPMPVQVADVEYWSDKKQYVKSATLHFVVPELKPLATHSYTVSWGGAKAPVASDLNVVKKKDSVEIATKQVQLRLPLGSAVLKTPGAAIPGPLVSMQMLGSGWKGGSSFFGDAKVKQWESRLVDAGPVFARVKTTYTFADDNQLELNTIVLAGDNAVRWEMAVRDNQPTLGVELRVPFVAGVKEMLLPKRYGQWGRDRKAPVKAGDEPIAALSPESSVIEIFADKPSSMTLVAGKDKALHLESYDPGAWVDPAAPQTYGGYKVWQLKNIDNHWKMWRDKCMPVHYAADGTLSMRPNLLKGQRKWLLSTGKPVVGMTLNKRNNMVLDWTPDPKVTHPRLFMDQKHIEAMWKRAESDKDLMALLKNGRWAGQALAVLMVPAEKRTQKQIDAVVNLLREPLAQLGQYDVMRCAIRYTALYDALIDSGLLSAQDKKLFRAQMAYLGYQLADPQTWSMERGYMSGNPNMSISYTVSLGLIACTLPDHPMAKAWSDYTIRWIDTWLTDEVGENGVWIPEGSHYGFVSLEPLISYAIAAKRAGFHDFSNDPRLKKMILYFSKYHTPRDPQRNNLRVTGAYGRGTSGDRLGVTGMAARLTAQVDPEYSATMQWLWAENGYPPYVGDYRLGGYEPYYVDRSLPMKAPAWKSELFPNLGVVLRAGFATKHESYVNFLSCVQSVRNLDLWTPGVGDISQWFGRGAPLSACFTHDTGYRTRHEFLSEGVRLARNWGAPEDSIVPFGYYTTTAFDTFAPLAQADYARSTITYTHADTREWVPQPPVPALPRMKAATEGKLAWTRQVLFLKDALAEGPAYLVLRDTVQGGQPTVWQFPILSEKIGTPAEAAKGEAFLADKPGDKILPARALAQSNRYTAVGQQGVDVECFIAAPQNTPRHTFRYGGVWARVSDYQDFLHLQRADDGAYYVVLYPRLQTEKAPAFTTLADGKVIKIAGAFGTDYAFLTTEKTSASAEGARFDGTSASVQTRAEATTLSLGDAGEVEWKGQTLSAPVAASVTVTKDTLKVVCPLAKEERTMTVTVPGKAWALSGNANGVTLKQDGKSLVLQFAANATEATLSAR